MSWPAILKDDLKKSWEENFPDGWDHIKATDRLSIIMREIGMFLSETKCPECGKNRFRVYEEQKSSICWDCVYVEEEGRGDKASKDIYCVEDFEETGGA